MLAPAFFEQGALGEVFLRVQNEDLGRRVLHLELMGDHRNPLIGAGRAAIGVRGGDHGKSAALRHRLDLRLQKLRLRSGLVGVRHRFGHVERPARHGIVHKIDPRCDHQTIIGQHIAIAQGDGAGRTVHAGRHVLHHIDAHARQRAIGVTKAVKLAETADIEV